MTDAEMLLQQIQVGNYGTNLDDCIEWAIVKYFDEKEV